MNASQLNTTVWALASDPDSIALLSVSSVATTAFIIESVLIIVVLLGHQANRLFCCYQYPKDQVHVRAKFTLHLTLIILLGFALFKIAWFCVIIIHTIMHIISPVTLFLCVVASTWYDALFAMLLVLWLRICSSIVYQGKWHNALVVATRVALAILVTISLSNIIYCGVIIFAMPTLSSSLSAVSVAVMIAVKVILVVIFVVLAIRIMYMIKQGKSKLSDDERFVVTKISIGIVAIIVSVSAFIVGLILGLYVFTWLGIIAITVPEFLLFAVLTFLFWPKELVRKKEETFVLASP